MKIIEKYSNIIILILLLLVFFRSCGVGSDVSRLNKKIISIENKIDTLEKRSITEKVLNKNLQNNMWDFLELEELSDKNKIPINQLKNERYKK
jgi:uncharacterized protein Yka (UPF0111/DUF47 family)